MNRNFVAILGMMTGFMSAAAYAAPGEYWEVTNKMEMPGMPFAMPATTQKVCISKGSESNPEKTSGDKSCKMTDVKTVGNKTTWKARCDRDGEIMTGSRRANHQRQRLSGQDAILRQVARSGYEHDHGVQRQACRRQLRFGRAGQERRSKAQICDTSRYHSTADWISGSDLILQPGSALRRSAPAVVRTWYARTLPKTFKPTTPCTCTSSICWRRLHRQGMQVGYDCHHQVDLQDD